MCLPATDDDWEKANIYFKQSIVPLVQSELSVDGKYTALVVPIQVGVYQGDPLSVVTFNTVVNTMVDTLKTRTDLGYSFSPSQKSVNLLQ